MHTGHNRPKGRQVTWKQYQAYWNRFDLLPKEVRTILWDGVRPFNTDHVWKVLAGYGYAPGGKNAARNQTAIERTVQAIYSWQNSDAKVVQLNPKAGEGEPTLCRKAKVGMLYAHPVPAYVVDVD